MVRIHQWLVAREKLPAITKHGPDLLLRNALWDAAVAAYGRCNNNGSRSPKIEGLVKKLPEHLRACHERVKEARNKQVAHHDEPEEQREQRSSAAVVFDAAGTTLGLRV